MTASTTSIMAADDAVETAILAPIQRSALQAFGQVVPADVFEANFAAALEHRMAEPVHPVEIAFLAALLDRDRWGDRAWFGDMSHAWSDCRTNGGRAGLLAAAISALVEAVQATLAGGSSRNPEQEILLAAGQLGIAVQAMLANVELTQLNQRILAGEGADPVTGLPTRARFLQTLEHALAVSGRAPLGLLLVHVEPPASPSDGANPRPDRLRWQISRAMEPVLRASDVLCAISEQEWALVMPRLTSIAQVQLAAQRLVAVCEGLPERTLNGAVHVGAACAPIDGDSTPVLERAARAALHHAVRENTPVVRFEPPMLAMMARDLEIEREISSNIARPPFMIWLQPQVSLATGRCIGAEALLRWQRTDGDWISPPDIVATAVRLGLMAGVSRWLLTQVVRMIGDLEQAGVGIPVAINLVAEDLHDDELPVLVAQTLAAWQVPPQRLILEVTEGALISDRARAARVIQALRELGCGVSLDDFGTGFSSFAYLRDLPVSELKIDQLFIREMLHSPRDEAIVSAVQALAAGFGLTVVAEGVEDEATAAVLREIGCDHAQGFLYARAMPLAEFIAWAQHRSTEAAGT